MTEPLVVIPARYASTRFPGKPLVDIFGKPMIQRVWEQSCKAVGPENVLIVTDDDKVLSLANSIGAKAEMVAEDCLTGTDRVARAAGTADRPCIINVQGDEPFVHPSHISMVRDLIQKEYASDVVNLMTAITNEEDVESKDVPKCVVGAEGNLLYMSRCPIPGQKAGLANSNAKHFRQVCVYGYRKNALDRFSAESKKTPLEEAEDIEILRFLELGFSVKMVEVDGAPPGIDRPSDISRLGAWLEKHD